MAKKGLWYRFVAWFVRTFFFPAIGGIRVIGKENVPKNGAFILASVHMSHLDPPLLGSTCPRELRFMAKEELFRNPIFGNLIRSVGAFPIKRGSSDRAAIKLSLQWLEEGYGVLVFPEGGRGDGRKLQPLQGGAHLLAKKSGAVVVPAGISGTERVLGRGQKGLKRHRITLVYGKPFSASDDRESFNAELSERIIEACEAAGLRLEPSAQ